MRGFLAVALFAAFAAWPITTMAHEGHDHGTKQTTKASKQVKKPGKKRSHLEEPIIRFVVTPTG